jgi:hypothetical protein
MARFEGSIQEFHHYIGPRIRNIINTFAKKERMARKGVCEGLEGRNCGKTDQTLESAHIHGRGRRNIIEDILLQRYFKEDIVQCDLKSIEKEILEEHGTIADAFKFLCHQCHVEYDNLERNMLSTISNPSSIGDLSRQSITPVSINANELNLKFFPDNEVLFKTLLIKSQKAYIFLRKVDGTFEQRTWDATRFRETSNLRGNIFSGYLRNWKQKGIVEAKFSITKFEDII